MRLLKTKFVNYNMISYLCIIDMQQLSSHIEYLLDRHDCVIVPGFGAFIKTVEPAHVDVNLNTIVPPRRTISFNRELHFDDGLLSNSFSRAQHISYTSATNKIRNEVEYMNHTLDNGGIVNVGSIGNITSIDNSILFTPYESLYASMGYQAIRTRLIAQNDSVTDDTAKTHVIAPPSKFVKGVHAIMKYAAMLLLLFSVAIVLSTPLSPDNSDKITKATLNPIDVLLSAPTADDIDSSIAPILYIAEPLTNDTQSNCDFNKDANYCLVIASLANLDQANAFMTTAGEDALGYIEANGRYRVYATMGPTIESVMSSELISRYPDAWPCPINK